MKGENHFMFSNDYNIKFSIIILTALFLVIVTPITQANGDEALIKDSNNLKAYFPLHSDIEYSYAGEGIEYASFKRKVMYVEDKYLQLTDNNGGTIVVKIYKFADNEIREVYSKGEFYKEDNIIPDIRNKNEGHIILQTPLKVGHSWQNENEKREIVANNAKVMVPAGTFYQVVKIKISHFDSDNISYNYFAPNIGLIKSEYLGENFKVKSELKTMNINK
jgi:hypothetical protein